MNIKLYILVIILSFGCGLFNQNRYDDYNHDSMSNLYGEEITYLDSSLIIDDCKHESEWYFECLLTNYMEIWEPDIKFPEVNSYVHWTNDRILSLTAILEGVSKNAFAGILSSKKLMLEFYNKVNFNLLETSENFKISDFHRLLQQMIGDLCKFDNSESKKILYRILMINATLDDLGYKVKMDHHSSTHVGMSVYNSCMRRMIMEVPEGASLNIDAMMGVWAWEYRTLGLDEQYKNDDYYIMDKMIETLKENKIIELITIE